MKTEMLCSIDLKYLKEVKAFYLGRSLIEDDFRDFWFFGRILIIDVASPENFLLTEAKPLRFFSDVGAFLKNSKSTSQFDTTIYDVEQLYELRLSINDQLIWIQDNKRSSVFNLSEFKSAFVNERERLLNDIEILCPEIVSHPEYKLVIDAMKESV
jgi:hypothetical protein